MSGSLRRRGRAVPVAMACAAIVVAGPIGGCGSSARHGGLSPAERSTLLADVARAGAAVRTDPAAVATDLDRLAGEVRRLRSRGSLDPALAGRLLAQIGAGRTAATRAVAAVAPTTTVPAGPTVAAAPVVGAEHGHGHGKGHGDGGGGGDGGGDGGD